MSCQSPLGPRGGNWISQRVLEGLEDRLRDPFALSSCSGIACDTLQPWGWHHSLTGLLGLTLLSATAQIGDQDPCRNACHEAHARCVGNCGEHSNPMECDARCDEAMQECESSCR